MTNSENSPVGDRQSARREMKALPSNALEKEFGKVYVGDDGAERHVEFTVWVQELSGAGAEGWRTGVALDASCSMRDWYGRSLVYVEAGIPQNVLDDYARKGWAEYRVEDGDNVLAFKQQAHEDALRRGFVKFTDNIVEPLAQDFLAYLGQELDTSGKTAAVYWACGSGNEYEVIGEFSPVECKTLSITGPEAVRFGDGTELLPAMKYFCNTYLSAKNSMFVFITDGRLDDLEAVKKYTTQLAKEVEGKQRNPVKCVLIGVGGQIDEAQMEELDDLETGTDIDIWDHKIAKELRALSEIMVELVDEVVCSLPATIYDDQENVVKKFSDGLPSSVAFTMPASSQFFTLDVGGHRVKQSVKIS